MNRKQRNIYTDFHRPHYYIAYFFLICARFCFVSVLVPDSSREASFFLSFPSADASGLLICPLTSRFPPVRAVDRWSMTRFYPRRAPSHLRVNRKQLQRQNLTSSSSSDINTSINDYCAFSKNSPIPEPITSPIGLNLLICKQILRMC